MLCVDEVAGMIDERWVGYDERSFDEGEGAIVVPH
jgi:hypothetical protein